MTGNRAASIFSGWKGGVWDEVTEAQLKCDVPSHTQIDDFLVKVPSLEQILCRGRFRHPGSYRRIPSLSTVCTRTPSGQRNLEQRAKAFSFLNIRSDFLSVAVVPALLATPSVALGDLTSSASVAARPTRGDDVPEDHGGSILCPRAGHPAPTRPIAIGRNRLPALHNTQFRDKAWSSVARANHIRRVNGILSGCG